MLHQRTMSTILGFADGYTTKWNEEKYHFELYKEYYSNFFGAPSKLTCTTDFKKHCETEITKKIAEHQEDIELVDFGIFLKNCVIPIIFAKQKSFSSQIEDMSLVSSNKLLKLQVPDLKKFQETIHSKLESDTAKELLKNAANNSGIINIFKTNIFSELNAYIAANLLLQKVGIPVALMHL